MRYSGSCALVTGGLGFIGSNLALRLVAEGARVIVVDSSVPGCGANPFNLEPARDAIELAPLDIGEPETLRPYIERASVIFNLAGEISHVHSMEFPERDLQINTVAQLRFVLACRDWNPGVRIVYAGTRQIYGVPEYLPVDERHPVQPVDFNGIHKYAATMYHLMLARSGQLDAVVLRLTNVYGPRMALDIPCQGFLSTFLRRLLLHQPLDVYGDGHQLRDPIYVDDCVEAFLLAGWHPAPESRVYNVGGPEPLPLGGIAEIAAQAAGGVALNRKPFPPQAKAIDIGSYYTDSSRIARELGWKPGVRFEEGIARTLGYYRQHLAHYLDPANPHPACSMPEHSGKRGRLSYAHS